MTNTGWLIPQGGIGRPVELGDRVAKLDLMYREIGCDTVDVVRVTPTIDAWLDDEGMYRSQPNLVAMMVVERVAGVRLQQPLFGSLLFLARAGADSVGLFEEDLAILEGQTQVAYDELLLDALNIRARRRSS